MKKTILSLASFFIILTGFAGRPPHTSPDDTLNTLIGNGTMGFSNNIDSLLNQYFMQQLVTAGDSSFIVEEFTDNIVPEFPDSVYIERIRGLNSYIHLTFNPIVRNYIHVYTQKKRELTETMLGVQDFYLPAFEEMLAANNMPLELKYLPVIESALNPNAVSRAGATGIWQFMYGTGKLYKLEINTWVDERRDPLRATYAAIAFMKDLYSIYNDWVLVIAAYNCGPGNVNKAIRRSGGKRNYWDIYYHLPRETRGYVPAFIAANYVMNYHKEHNIVPKKAEMPLLCDTIMVSEQLHLKQVASVLQMPVETLRMLNPQYRYDILPGKGKEYCLRLPYEYVNKYIDLEDSILNYKDSVFFDPEIIKKTPSRYKDYVPNPPSKNHAKINYKVKDGDNLGYISQWFNVGLSDLKYWNHLRRNTIRKGQNLVIYVPKAKQNYYSEMNNMSFEKKRELTGKPAVVVPKSTPVAEKSTGNFVYYTVKKGDTLWEIAQRYPGISDKDILKLNGLASARSIFPGQKLKIKRKS